MELLMFKKKYEWLPLDKYYESIIKSIKIDCAKNQTNIIFVPKDLIQNPYFLYTIMYYNKKISKGFILTQSIILIVCLISNFTTNIYLSNKIFTKENLYNNKIINSPILIFTLFLILSNYFFYFMNKFCGLKIWLSICYVFCFILSICYEAPFNTPEMSDFNNYGRDQVDLFNIDTNPIYHKQIYITLLSYVKGFFKLFNILEENLFQMFVFWQYIHIKFLFILFRRVLRTHYR